MDSLRVKMVSVWFALALLTFISLEASGMNPGVKIRVTQKGLEYERQISINPLQKMLKSIKIPDMHGTAEVLFMDVRYWVTGMSITNVALRSSTVQLVPGTGVSLSISNALIFLKGNWRVEYLFIDDDGWFEMTVSGLRVDVTISVNNDGTGHPMVGTAYCTASIQRVAVSLHGGFSWLYNLFDDTIDTEVQRSLQPQICTLVKEAVNSLNPHLKTLNVLEQIDNYAEIEYSMVGSPFVTNLGVDLSLKGEFYRIGHHEEPPFSPTPFTLPAQDSKMLYIGLSAFTLKSAGFVYDRARVLRFYITDDMIPSGSPFRLDTMTFGKLIPQIAKLYPGLKIKLLVNDTKEPDISLEPDNMTMQVYSAVTAYAIQLNATLTPLFTLNLNASVSSLIYISGIRVYGNLTLNDIDMTLAVSYVGPFQVKLLEQVLKSILDTALMPIINDLLKQGYPLPVIGQMNLYNAHLQIMKDYVLIGTDVYFMERDIPNVL